MNKPPETKHRKGTIGKHGHCDECGADYERRHNARWCRTCGYVEHIPTTEKD